jgi:hypothetical protein
MREVFHAAIPTFFNYITIIVQFSFCKELFSDDTIFEKNYL